MAIDIGITETTIEGAPTNPEVLQTIEYIKSQYQSTEIVETDDGKTTIQVFGTINTKKEVERILSSRRITILS